MVQICPIFTKDHSTDQCTLLPGLKVVSKEAGEETKPTYLMAHHQQWQAHPSGTVQYPSLFYFG